MKIRQQVGVAVAALGLTLMMFMHTAVAAEEINTTIPGILADMKEHAGEIVETLLAKDETASRSYYQQLSREMNSLERLVRAGPLDGRRSRELLMGYAWMRVIHIEMTEGYWLGAAIGANQLSGMIIQAQDFPALLQRDIAWLDYLGHEIELLTLEDPAANADLLNVRLITLENTWARVSKELIKDFKNKPLLMHGDTLVASLKAAKGPAETVALAKELLDFADLIEKAK